MKKIGDRTPKPVTRTVSSSTLAGSSRSLEPMTTMREENCKGYKLGQSRCDSCLLLVDIVIVSRGTSASQTCRFPDTSSPTSAVHFHRERHSVEDCIRPPEYSHAVRPRAWTSATLTTSSPDTTSGPCNGPSLLQSKAAAQQPSIGLMIDPRLIEFVA